MGYVNYEYLKLTAQSEENKGDKSFEKSCFRDALRAYKNAQMQYEKMAAVGGAEDFQTVELCKMRVENKIRKSEQAIAGKAGVSAAADPQTQPKAQPQTPQKNPSSSQSSSSQQKAENDGAEKLFPIERQTGVTFDDIIGLEDVKKDLKKALVPLKYPDKAKYYKIRPGGFLVLFGPPGTGKTSIAKAITTEFDADMIVLRSSDIYSSYVGETEKNIATLFNQVNESERFTILYFDDGDTFFTRGGIGEGYQARYLNEWKTQLDGFAGRANTLVILSCNDPEILDPAILSRGTGKFYVALPDEDARKKIFEKELSGVLLDEDVDVAALAKKTPRYSGRNIHNICDDAKKERYLKVVEAEERGDTDVKEGVCQEDLLDSLKKVKPDVSEVDIRRYEEIAKRIAKG